MHREIPFLDMRRSPGDPVNCWIVYLMPFDPEERGDYEKIDTFQQSCIDHKIFGMGWDIVNEPLSYGTSIQDGAEIYKERYGPNSGMENALKQYKRVQKGDYVLTRLKNGHYYVGRVIEPAIYVQQDQEPYINLSWAVEWSGGRNMPRRRISRQRSEGGFPRSVTPQYREWMDIGSVC